MAGQATRTDVARTYAPRLLADWMATAPDRTARQVDGTVVFVDISGFTKLSERLARHGRLGAEELSETIGSCFERLLAVAYDGGAGLIKFGGDALLLLFQGPDHPADACRAAFLMRAVLREMASIECSGTRVTLRMSVGVHTGQFDFFLVGGSHRELLVTGPAATETVRMEAAAEAGEIVVSPATAARLPAGTVGAGKGPGHLLRRAPDGTRPGRVDLRVRSTASLADCLPVALRDLLLSGGGEPEHKSAVVAFVHFDGTDELIRTGGACAAAAALDRLVRDVQHAADRYGVCFLGSDIDQDGGKIILSSGVPTSSGRDEETMLLAVSEVVAAERPLTVRVGVNTGHVFAGHIGPGYRRTYTVMGDAVNLAARLMARASAGQTIATPLVLARSQTRFDTEELEPFLVKGKSAPVQAFSVGAPRAAAAAAPASGRPFVGREAELDVLRSALRAAADSGGRAIAVVGEAGIGKSRLVDELAAGSDGWRVVRAGCRPYETLTPYFASRQLLRPALGLPDAAGSGETGEALLRLLGERCPDLLPWAPLVATAVDADVPMTPEVERLDAEFRRRRLEQATAELLSALVETPTLLVVEDAHWMDEPSADLLRQVAMSIGNRPCVLCLTARDVPPGFAALEGVRADVLRPEPLDAPSAYALAEVLSERTPLAPHDVAALVSRSAGNPLFLAELLAAAEAAGSVEALPDSVEAVIVSRLDGLAQDDRALLRRLSVLGPAFEHALARAVLADALPDLHDETWQRLRDFVDLEGGATLRFRSALVRDGAYESLPFRLRRQLHESVAQALEQSLPDPESAAGVLSLHFFHAQRFDKAWQYSRTAADRARAAYANVEAANLYDRALQAAEREGRPAPERAALLEALGDVRCRLGEFVKAGQAYRWAHRAAEGESLTQARLLLKQGTTRQRLGRYAAAGRWLGRARRALDPLPGSDAARLRAQVAVSYASLAKDEGRLSRVVTWATRCIREAEVAGEKDALARAYSLLDAAFAALGKVEAAAYGNQALTLYMELDDLWGQGVVLNNLGTRAYWQGAWDDAVGLYERSGQAWQEIGDFVNAAISLANIGEIRSDQGRLEEAEVLFRRAQRIWLAAGDRASVAFANSNLGRLAARAARYDEAATLLEAACTEYAASGARAEMQEPELRIIESLVLQGRYAEALPLVERAATEHVHVHEGTFGQHAALLHRLAGYTHFGLGDGASAGAALRTSLLAGRDRHNDFEIALTLRARHRCGFTDGVEAEDELAESQRLLERLGVVAVFEPPLLPRARQEAQRIAAVAKG